MKNGALAGLAATAVLSVLMIMKSIMGIMPQFNVIADWVAVLAKFGLPASMALGWIAHIALGAVFGVGFSQVRSMLPASDIVAGIAFGVVAWLGMMIFFMPLAGNGVFGMNIGMMVPVMTLILHVVFGAVLGFVFRKLNATI